MSKVNYDEKNDILYLSFGNKKYSYGDESIDDYIIFRDYSSEEITGLTILDFMEKYNNGTLSDIGLPIRIDFQKDIAPLVLA